MTEPSLSTTDRNKFKLSDTNTILHHIKWASALTRDQKLETQTKYRKEAIQKNSIKEQSRKDREFTLKMLNLMKQSKTKNEVQVDKVVINNIIEEVQRGNILKLKIKQMKRERRFPQPKTLKNRGYQYGFISKKISKILILNK